MCLRLSIVANASQGRDLSDAAKTSELLDSILSDSRQTLQLFGHEINDVIGVVLCPNVSDVPLPIRRDSVECEQALNSQRCQKLDREEWIAARFFEHQLSQ